MSTGLECEIVERRRGEWYYILEHWDAPKNAWDWRMYATCYGPFTSREKAEENLFNNHANPGGYTVYSLVDSDGWHTEDEVLTRLFEDATKPRCRIRIRGW